MTRDSKSGDRPGRSIFKDRRRRLGARHPQAKWAYYLFRFLFFEGLNYAENCARNSVKLLTRRKPYFSERNIFFRQYLRHLLGIQPIRRVTCSFSWLEGAGAGCQALFTMRAITFARACGLTYVHTPFAAIDHADRPMPLWVDVWEAQFNLGVGEELASESDNREIVNFPCNCVRLAVLFGFFDGCDLVRRFEATIPEFRRKYYWNKSPIQNEVFTICVHIRRGDVTADRFTSTSIFRKIVSEVTAVLDASDISYMIQIFTEGDPCDLAELNVPGAKIFSDVDAIWSMRQMIGADILIMSKSLFSYVAATISEGIKIGERYYEPLSGWIIVDSNGEFDRVEFEGQLVHYIEAKTSKQRSSEVMISGRGLRPQCLSEKSVPAL